MNLRGLLEQSVLFISTTLFIDMGLLLQTPNSIITKSFHSFPTTTRCNWASLHPSPFPHPPTPFYSPQSPLLFGNCEGCGVQGRGLTPAGALDLSFSWKSTEYCSQQLFTYRCVPETLLSAFVLYRFNPENHLIR